MKIKTKLFGALAALALLLPLGLGSGQVAKAADENTGTETQKVMIHKRQFENGDYPSKAIKNDGNEIEDFGGTPLVGAGFTAYDMTNIYWAAYENASGSHQDKEDAAIKAALAAELPANGEKFDNTGEDGTATKDLKVKSDGEKAIYRFVETTKPAGVVSENSHDFILGLPVYNEKTSEKLDIVHVYPKNEVKALNLKFTKYGVDKDGEVSPLQGAKFKLRNADGFFYKDGAFTKSESDAEVIESDEQGNVSVPSLNLTPGKYTFSEINSNVSVTGEQKDPTEAELYHYKKTDVVVAEVTENMEIKYTYYDKGQNEITEAKLAEAYNYKVPEPTKTADDNDLDIGQTVTFTITQLIPNDISDYTKFDLVDNYDANLDLISDKAAILGSVKIGDKTVSEIKPAYTAGENTFTLGFDPKTLVSHAGEAITFTVDMKLKPGTNLDTGVDNNIKFDNNFFPKTNKDTVQTYGKTFVKKDLVSGKTLAGAEFVVKSGDKFMLNTDGEISWVDTQDKATILTSDEKGEFSVAGLAKTDKDGTDITYQLVEIKAPEGYVLAKDPINFEADNGIKTFTVNNKSKGTLPSTGGKGIYAFIAIGTIAVAGAVFYFTRGRKQTEA